MAASAPRVEMLWESHEPGVVLRRRFGFDDARAAATWVEGTLERHWGLEVQQVARIVMSDSNALAWVHTTAGARIVKWSIAAAKFARLRAIAQLTRSLAEGGQPVSAPLPSLVGEPALELEGRLVSVQHVIEADLLDVGNVALVRNAGSTLARLHRALAGCTDPGDWQFVHGDFRSANLLCAGDSVVAVLDFEELQWGSRLEDVARAAVLLGTRFHDWGPVDPSVHRAFLCGYGEVLPFTAEQSGRLRELMLRCTQAFVPEGPDPTGWAAAARALANARDWEIRPIA